MIEYNVPIILCIAFVMGFQINFFFNSVFDKSTRKQYRFIYFIVFGTLAIIYLVFYISVITSSVLALLLIFSLAQSYNVEMKTKIIFSILYSVLMSIVNLISLYIFYVIDADDFNNFEPINLMASTKTILLSCIIMFAVIQMIRLIAKRRSFSLHYRYYILFLLVPLISIYQVNVLTYQSEKNIYFIISIIGFLFLNVLIVYIFDHIIDKFQLKHENDQLQQQMDYQDANYEKTVHSFKSIKRIIHDTNQQFLYIEACIKQNELASA